MEIRLAVLKPFYLQSWFFALSALIFSLFAYWIYKFNLNRNLSKAETKRIKDLDALKTKLYTYISHEFRTPLTVIMGMADDIQDQPLEQQLIKRNSKNLLHLVNQLLDLSKLDAGLLNLNLNQADIIGFLNYLIESFYSMAREKNLRLTFDSEEKEMYMDFDESRIQQITYNLVSNAIKFTPENGSVAVVVRKVQVEDQPFAQIRVRDSGIGIPEEQIKHIFDRFYQVDSSSTRTGEPVLRSFNKGGGTGIGLALTKELIVMMGGSISVSSDAGKGTAFTFLLPIKQEAVIAEPELKKEGDQDLSYKSTDAEDMNSVSLHEQAVEDGLPQLLIIEDNKDVATYIKSCVRRDYRVHYAVNGSEGIKRAIEIIPDIIISDVMMPEKDGYEVTETLKKHELTCHIPILLLTAKAAMADKVQGLEVGADAYLMKPFHKEELLVRLRKLVELRKQLHSYYSNLSDQDIPSEKALSMDEIFVQKLHKLINEEISNPVLSVEDLCAVVAMSQAQLYRKIKALTGKTPALFIRSIRLAKAVELLKSGEMNVSEVAYEVGFSDPNYFSRIFSKEIGEAPSSVLLG